MNVVAPGKLFLFGEYAVLEGAPCLVSAVARLAKGRATSSAPSELARWTREALVVELESAGEEPALPNEASGFEIDTSALSSSEGKLGLGSSAAACVAGAALLVHGRGESLASDATRARIFRVARAVHDRLQGERGSGADIAASVEGGLLRYEIGGGGRSTAARLPSALRLLFVPTRVAASTRVLVSKVRELRATDPAAYGRRLRVLGGLSRELLEDLGERSASEVCLYVHAYAAQLEALGQDAGISILSEPHRRILEIARAHGCAAKPSGAGGGDMAIVFCPGPAEMLAAEGALAQAGWPPMRLERDELGVRLQVEDETKPD